MDEPDKHVSDRGHSLKYVIAFILNNPVKANK